MNTLRTLGSFAVLASTLALAACDGGGSSSTGTPAERIDAVKSALSKPSGKLDATSAPGVIAGLQAQLDLSGISALLQGLGTTASIPASCGTIDATGGTVDLSCTSDGKATGKVTLEVQAGASGSGASAYVSMTLENACEGGTCIDGTLVTSTEASASGAKVILDADFDATTAGATKHAHLGVSTSTGAAGSTVDVVVFDDAGDSFVVHTAVDAGGASVDIEGANGSFSCSHSGAKGSCTGAGTFSW